jgi:hypothetical protein
MSSPNVPTPGLVAVPILVPGRVDRLKKAGKHLTPRWRQRNGYRQMLRFTHSNVTELAFQVMLNEIQRDPRKGPNHGGNT